MGKRYKIYGGVFVSALLLLLISCTSNTEKANTETLKTAFSDFFYIGAALNIPQVNGADSGALQVIESQFNSITAENETKWERINPLPGVYKFEVTDKLAELGEKNNMFVIGHTLVWHSQTPDWVFEDGMGNLTTRDTLLKRMRNHIFTVVGRYKGKINGWDVVNEALNDDGTLRQSKWYKIIGEDYIEKAFEYAHEADPDAELYYNDYSLPKPEKRKGVVKLINSLKEKGIKVDGIGMQGHYNFDFPDLKELEESIIVFAESGCKVMITELDLTVLPVPAYLSGAEVDQNFELEKDMNPYIDGLPDSMQVKLANRYAELFDLFVKHSDKISRVTFWGVNDNQSWRNNWPIKGRTDYALLFGRKNSPKPCFDAVINSAKQKK